MAAPLPIQMPSQDAAPPLIALLRLAALECRAAPRQTLQACATIDPAALAEDYAIALARALPAAAERRIVLWRPGASGLSFDERWLLGLLSASRRGDRDSERFLLARRLRPAAVPAIRALIRGLSRQFETHEQK